MFDPRQRLRFGDPRPERQRPVEQRRRGARRAAAFDRARGVHGAAQRLRLVARGVEVMGDRGGADRQVVVVGQRRLERPRQPQVQLGAFARQQVVVDHLAQQRVAEAVAVVAADQDHLRLDRLAQPRRQLVLVELADGDEVVVFEPPGDGEHPQQPREPSRAAVRSAGAARRAGWRGGGRGRRAPPRAAPR